MNFETSKNLGGIGALLMFLGIIALFVDQTLVFGIIEIIGTLLVIVSLYGLADFYRNKKIFTNGLFSGVAVIIGIIIIDIIAVVKFLPLTKDLVYKIYPEWNGDPSTIQSLTPDIANLDVSAMMPMLTMLLLIIVVFCVFAIIAAFFARQSLKDLATHSDTPRFATVGLIVLIGAVLSIILVGVLLIWIATLILAITFFAMKKPQPTPPTPV
ncbi:MAG: DUF996 domain-containing protein [Candidatus Bathyarchaeota archaeon]|nr:DUF996 domain-containing protein [Candidatus Termiticorpusculum sp.]